jgi:TPR repeat protein
MLSKGQGCTPDQSKAWRYFTLAADQGLAEAQLVLGEAYRLGRGVEPDPNAARRWYELAASQGNQVASRMLLEHFKNPRGPISPQLSTA